MKLNYDAVRAVLLYVEENIQYKDGELINYLNQRQIVEDISTCKLYTKDDLYYSIIELLTTQYLDLVEPPKFNKVTGDLILVKIKGLTFDGSCFLNDIRKDTVWEALKTQSKIIGTGSIKAIASAAKGLSVAMLADPNALNNLTDGIKGILSYF